MQALEMAANNASLRISRKVILTLLEHLKNGLSFSDSMARVHGWMPDFDIALLSAGEHAGRLDYSFKQLGMYYANHAAVIRETIAGVWWTALTLHVFIFIFPLGWFIEFVLGIVNREYGRCLPFLIERSCIYALVWGSVFFVIFACQGNRGERWRALLERIYRIVPVLRTALRYLVLSRLAGALEALVVSGVSILKGWPLSAAASGSPRLKKAVDQWKTQLEGGSTPSELIAQTPYFPEMFRNLYHTGEISGKLDESLNRLHTYYREEGFRLLRLFTRILNGAFYIIVVILVGIFVIHFWVQYYRNLLNSI